MTTLELVTLYWLTACAVTTLALCRWFAISQPKRNLYEQEED
jgi:hypothetical protein